MTAQPELASLESEIRFLTEFFSRQPGSAEIRETHLSFVFLTATRAYKLKKPVKYDYLDFTTPELRRRNAEEEVRLNRRFAKDVYLGVTPVFWSQGKFHLGPHADGSAVDWLVEMRRLPAERMLDRLIRSQTVSADDIGRAGRHIAQAHGRCTRLDLAGEVYRKRLAHEVAVNLQELTAPGNHLQRHWVEPACAAQFALIEGDKPLFDERVREGHIIDGHGDLRPEHVCLCDPPAAIDCIEFCPEFRILDTADDVGLLDLECELLGASVSDQLWEAYGQASGSRPPQRLIHFYESLRATVRARIAMRRWSEHGTPGWRVKGRAYLRLARRHAGLIS